MGREEPRASSERYPAALYAALHRGNPGDVAFYLEACRGASRVLELGCGYGRVLRPLAEAGHAVTGVDLDPDLAAMARAAVAPLGGRVIVGDMAGLALGERFDRVIVPFHGLYCLLDEGAVRRCFEAVRAHLAEGGRLVFDAWAADRFHAEGDASGLPDDHLEPVGTVEAQGIIYDVFEQSRWDRARQRIEARYVHVARDGSGVIECALPQRYLRSDEAVALLEDAGLVPVTIHGGFDGSVYDEDSDLLVVTAAARP